MATYIDNIVKFHTFSKSPVSKDTTLGGAVNPSGHTVTTSQVRAQDIPAFLNTFQGTKEQAITWLGTNYPTPAHNDIVFYGGEFKAGFSTPKCLKWNAKLETPAWEDFNITTAATLKNADDKDVIAVHQNCTTVFVDGSNNAATNSNRNSLFVKRADGSILDHFVASTDKIVAGMPSLGYNALVLWNGGAIDEGELDANYIGNTFAGIVHLNKQYSTGDDAKFKVTCFEYIGEKLDTSLGNIDGKIQDIVDTTMEGVVASVGTTTAATNAGISVDSSTKTSPKIDISTGTVGGASDAKLVTGSTVKSYVDGATAKATVSAEGVITTGDETKLVTATGAQNIAKKVASDATLADDQKIADTTETSKLVTAAQVKEYVEENAQVTVTVGETEVTSTGFEFEGSTGTDVSVGAAMDSNGKVTYSATLSKATVEATTGAITNGSLAVSATDAKTIADKAIETALADTANGSLGSRLAAVEGTANTAVQTVTAPGAEKSNTTVTITAATLNADNKSFTNDGYFIKASDVVTVATTIATEKVASIETTGTAKIEANAESTSTKLATEASVAKSIKTLEGDIEAIKTGDGSIGSRLEAVEDSLADGGATAEAIKSKVSSVTGPTTGHVTVITDPSTKVVTIGVSDIASAATLSQVQTTANSAIQNVKVNGTDVTKTNNAVDITAIVGVDETSYNGIKVVETSDNKVAVDVTTAIYTKATEGVKGSWSDDAKVAKASDVKAAIADVETAHGKDIQALQTAVNGLTTTGLTREVLPDDQTTNDIQNPKENVIYLVKDKDDAESGSYIEYLYVGTGFEPIGTTKTDLSEYVTNSSLATTLEGYTTTAKHSDLESTVSALSIVVTDNKIAAETAIALKADQSALNETNAAIETLNGTTIPGITDRLDAIEAIPTVEVVAAAGTDEAPNYVTVSSSTTDGKTTFTVASTGALETRLDTLETFVGGSGTPGQGLSELLAKKVDDVTGGSNGITIATADTTDGRVATLAISADTTVTEDSTNVVTSGAVYTAIANAKPANYVTAVKVGQATTTGEVTVEIEAKTEATHFGSELINASLADSKVTITAAPAKEWSVSDVAESLDSIASITSVINGKMNDGKTIDDANLTDGTSMFAGNEALKTYVGDLGKLTTGTNMFSGCTGLSTFCGNLASLTNGEGMFSDCELDENSLIYIVDSLPTFPVETPLAHTITVGVADGVVKDPYVTEAAAKGWALV